MTLKKLRELPLEELEELEEHLSVARVSISQQLSEVKIKESLTDKEFHWKCQAKTALRIKKTLHQKVLQVIKEKRKQEKQETHLRNLAKSRERKKEARNLSQLRDKRLITLLRNYVGESKFLELCKKLEDEN